MKYLKKLFTNISLIVVFLLTANSISLKSQNVIAKKSNSFEAIILKSFENEVQPKQSFVYKEVNGKELKIHGFFPTNNAAQHPCLIFIHGGGWSGGTSKGSMKWCRYLSELGIVAFTIDYRLSNEDKGIKPSTCLEDAKSAVRWVRKNAAIFNIDTSRIALAGNSAGGHLAAACATNETFNDPDDHLSISCKPNLLLLASPVIDNGPGGYGYDRVKDFWQEFSPIHNLNDQLPPTCMLLGDKDPLIPFESAVRFGQAVQESNSDIAFHVFEEKGHGLFSQEKGDLTEPIMLIYFHWHHFLAKQGYTKKPKKLKSDYTVVLSDYKL